MASEPIATVSAPARASSARGADAQLRDAWARVRLYWSDRGEWAITPHELATVLRDVPGSDSPLTLATALIAGHWIHWYRGVRPDGLDGSFAPIEPAERKRYLEQYGAACGEAREFEALFTPPPPRSGRPPSPPVVDACVERAANALRLRVGAGREAALDDLCAVHGDHAPEIPFDRLSGLLERLGVVRNEPDGRITVL